MAKKFRDLVADWSPERVAEVEARTRELLREVPLTELRHARDCTQERLAELLGMTLAKISRLERRSDMYLDSVRFRQPRFTAGAVSFRIRTYIRRLAHRRPSSR
jgi:DNA-binding XRE family transcriptional regulator